MNQREFTRVTLHTTAEVRWEDEVVTGEVENLSLNGVFVKSSAQIPADTPVEITILLVGASSELSVRIKGEVVRRESHGFAVRFQGMNLDSFFHLRSFFVARNADENAIRAEYREHIRKKGS